MRINVREGNVTKEVEIGAMLSQTKECEQTLGAEKRQRTDSPLEAPKTTALLIHLRLLISRTVN